MTTIRVFPRRTSHTPTDELAFVGDPPLWRPEAAEVRVSCTFSWDVPEAERLFKAWSQYYWNVQMGGPAFGDKPNGFTPGLYVKRGITFTSRGCDHRCSWCLVPEREGRLTVIEDFAEGHIVNDNNFLQCPKSHRESVYEMLRRQPRAAVFSGGIDARLVTDEVADEMRSIRIASLFLAADTERALEPLAEALKRLAFLGREKLRVYMLLAYGDDTMDKALSRLEAVWQMGAMPFAMLYQPVDRYIDYDRKWRKLAKHWSRPAFMRVMHKT